MKRIFASLLIGALFISSSAANAGWRIKIKGPKITLPSKPKDYIPEIRIGQNTVDSLNPIPATIKTVAGAVTLDKDKFYEGVGSLVTKASCPVCTVTAGEILAKKDEAVLSRIVGRGWVFFALDGNPVIMFADLSLSQPKTQQIGTNEVIPDPVPAGRQQRTWLATAHCLVRSEKNSVVATFIIAPEFKDEQTGEKFVFPEGDVSIGDHIKFKAIGEDCQEPPKGQSNLSEQEIVFKSLDIRFGTSTEQKIFLLGEAI
ncbi:hypothetical protein [Novosphingobium sp.]|uniref:hypothetical protein n=1 Tax=Novosphingobium sp. TaxID=1874826 RepID=UPI001D5F2EC6|nr:hypothetical protein [Novosphingobium sp.]MBX9661946.1 hypothetical protein [Novosphingobium sp.]